MVAYDDSGHGSQEVSDWEKWGYDLNVPFKGTFLVTQLSSTRV